ncbi:MAG: polyprenyl glycosylphosphotransferase, partial [Sphingomonas bacterium]|nr:polyprenyl glycosylphosphotransferase [Sphingomonas bacterium]
ACSIVFLVRNIALYPGIRGSFFSFPSVMVCFALTFSFFLLFRIDYSRALLLSGSAATLIWLYIVQLMVERGPALRVGIVPFGDVATLSNEPMLKLQWLTHPQLSNDYDILVADFRADLSDEWEAFLADCALAGIPVLHVKQLHESLTGRVEIEHLSENSFGSLIPFIAYLRLRRAIDFVSALLAATILMPIFLVVALLIKLDSPGPVLFRQIRIGYRGEPFRVAKFRTMVTMRKDTDDARNDAITRDNDVRVTKLGRLLRRSRIDELPQILNILKGEMSWIGPRPEAEVLSRWYEAELPFYRYRHIVPPGITGWAQVNQGHVAELNQVMSKLHYDFYYIKNFSPWLDALIVVKTLQTVISGFGSR